MSVLDCGCGPGTITIGFADIVAPGDVVGTEIEESQIAHARERAKNLNVSNARFEVASIYELPFNDATFDAVFISAVLGNLKEPIRGIREAYRVLKEGGVIGIKEFDHGGDMFYPFESSIKKFNDLYLRLRRENDHDPYGGRKIGEYLQQAGFVDVWMSACYETYAEPIELRRAAEANIGLLTESWGETYVSRDWATQDEIERISDAWRQFANFPGAFFAVAWCEAVGWKNNKPGFA
jgi:SAM-dependent methyltransferase